MPRKSAAARESLWVPEIARKVCYHCGVAFQDEGEKNHCRMCFDIFCSSCWGHKVTLSPDYGYTEPQPVCVTCELLITSFPMFAAALHHNQGGQLLPRGQAVMVVGGSGPPAGTTPQPSLISRLSQWVSRSDEPSGTPTLSSTIKAKKASPIFLMGWRPLNPSTALRIGRDLFINLGDVRHVDHTNERVVIVRHDLSSVHLLVGQVTTREPKKEKKPSKTKQPRASTEITAEKKRVSNGSQQRASSGSGNTANEPGPTEEDETEPEEIEPALPLEVDEFIFDSTAGFQLASSLSQLVKHARLHFAFGKASMALHPDLCPTNPSTAQSAPPACTSPAAAACQGSS